MNSVAESVRRPCSGRRPLSRCCLHVARVSLPAAATSMLFALFAAASVGRCPGPISHVSDAVLVRKEKTTSRGSAPIRTYCRDCRLYACSWAAGGPVARRETWGSFRAYRLSRPKKQHFCARSFFSAASASPHAYGRGCHLSVSPTTRTTSLLPAPHVTPGGLQHKARSGRAHVRTSAASILIPVTPTSAGATPPAAQVTPRASAVSPAARGTALLAKTALTAAVTIASKTTTAGVAAALSTASTDPSTTVQICAIEQESASSVACRALWVPYFLCPYRQISQLSSRRPPSSFSGVTLDSRKKKNFVVPAKTRPALYLSGSLLEMLWCRAHANSFTPSPPTALATAATKFRLAAVPTPDPAPGAVSAAAAPSPLAVAPRPAAIAAGAAAARVGPSPQRSSDPTASVVLQQHVVAGFAATRVRQPFPEVALQRQQQQPGCLPHFLASKFATMKPADGINDLQKQQTREKCCGTVRAVGSDWRMPTREGKLITGLVVNNSMAGGKVEFIPQKGNRVCWYACGPTVYDASHLGHARTYVTFDFIRRIMSDYFNYDVFLCMNITDIDDKIIKRSVERGVSFQELARHWEKDFFNDMAALNVRLPTVVTRVSEHIPEVLALVGRILKNGYAYESQGSIYFDTQAFDESDKHVYGRMEPSSVADESRALEGEGELGITSSEKRHPCDFALWKKAKEGEPSWDSPWGKGRPVRGEKEAMAPVFLNSLGNRQNFNFPGEVAGRGVCVRHYLRRSGGIDLRFPHHDNELAQSEAANDTPHWVNYFLHSGHLHIRGAKMSKSLKNFVTIKECLTRFSPRHLRLLCLMNRWDSLMNYSPDGETMQQAVDVDRSFVDFFALVRAKLRDAMPIATHSQKWDAAEVALSDELQCAKEQVHKCLLDNFNTPGALVALQRLISAANTYLNQHKGGSVRAPLVRAVAQYVFRMLRIFGVVKDEDEDMHYSRATVATEAGAVSAGSEVEENLLECIGSFREQVRTFAAQTLRALQKEQRKRCEVDPATATGATPANKQNDGADGGAGGGDAEAEQPNGTSSAATVKQGVTDLLRACDELRDEKLRALGILLQDRPDGTFVIKRVSKEELDREMGLKEEEEKKRLEQKKERLRMAAELQEKKKLERQTAPQDYYKVLHGDQYATYDAEGVPLTLKNGEEVSKSQRQKMQKFLQKHEKVYKEAQESASAVKKCF